MPSVTVFFSPLLVVRWKVIVCRPSATSAPTPTETLAEARPDPGSDSDPCDGLTVRPGSAVAVQDTLCPFWSTLAACSVVVVEDPGDATSEPGSTPATTDCWPWVYDGG